MEISTVVTQLDAAVQRQVGLSGDDPDVVEAAAALVAVLEPAIRQAAQSLAEQAALEVGAQLPDYQVHVVMAEGEPQLQVQPREVDAELTSGSHEARLTVRLPEHLKTLLEHAALDGGDSINSYVVKALASKTKSATRHHSNRIRTTIDL